MTAAREELLKEYERICHSRTKCAKCPLLYSMPQLIPCRYDMLLEEIRREGRQDDRQQPRL